MTFTDKCLAIAATILMVYGMVFTDISSPLNNDEMTAEPIHHQTHDKMARADSAQA